MHKIEYFTLGTTETGIKVSLSNDLLNVEAIEDWLIKWEVKDQIDILCMLEVTILKFFRDSAVKHVEENLFRFVYLTLRKETEKETFKSHLEKLGIVTSLDRVRRGKRLVSAFFI